VRNRKGQSVRNLVVMLHKAVEDMNKIKNMKEINAQSISKERKIKNIYI